MTSTTGSSSEGTDEFRPAQWSKEKREVWSADDQQQREERDLAEGSGRVLSGRCECRAVRYRVADEFLYAANCHCSNCRAGTGSAFKPFAGIERNKLELIEGADRLLVWGDDKENHTRCGICGSLLYSVVRDGAYVHVALGSLEHSPSIRPTEHIFVGSKADWFEITDHLPQSEEY